MPTLNKVPTTEELQAFLEDDAARRYPERTGWAAPFSIYDYHKPKGWCTAAIILRKQGLPETAQAWRRMVYERFGLHVPTKSDVRQAHDEAFMIRKYGRPVKLAYRPVESAGFSVLTRERQRGVWDWRRHVWVPQTYMAMVVR